MKKFISALMLFVTCQLSFAQQNIPETKKIETFIKIWGFLKYHHPEVAKGKLDWDNEFMARVKDIYVLKTKEDINNYYGTWLNKFEKVKLCKACRIKPKSNLQFNEDSKWLSDSETFEKNLIEDLNYIKDNRNQKSNYYVSQIPGVGNTEFKNEKEYKDSIFPSAEMRLLTLSRYWNIIQYFFPYKYKTDQSWDSVLQEMIPKFKTAADTTAYHLAILELTAKIDDSHGKFSSRYTNKYFGLKWVPFNFKIIENKAVVTGFYNEELCKKDDVRIGDVFLKIGGSTIEDILKRNLKYIGASNEDVKRRDVGYSILFNGQSNKVEVEFGREGKVELKALTRYGFNQINYKINAWNISDTSKLMKGNIGYINLGNLQQKQVDLVLNGFRNTKGIIFDLRNYPNGTYRKIAEFLNERPRAFVKLSVPDINNPGTYSFKEPIYCGKENSDFYKGKIVILCNEYTQSHAEFTLMALKTAPNVTVIGSNTSGADGNASIIGLPGGVRTIFTGVGVYYPDGRETQRIGIVPDVIVKPTIEGIIAGKDELLEHALAILNK